VDYIIDGEAKELQKLAKLSQSKSTEKILTFCQFKLPVLCEQDILYRIPIHHRETGVVTYILILRMIPTKEDLKKKAKDKKAYSFGDSDESVATDASEEYVVSGKRCRVSYDW
jgi:hypothetical protein